ncbi:MAG: P1 family peptidase [Acidobacteriota bacterium]|nr:P1 family peptidase [Blastocatellia bacterium]MDW8240635.1 P1 family peptidase [Acidobacteriota bacterium]
MDASSGSITDVVGVKVGQFTDTRRPTGCTVVLVEAGAVAGVDVRGGAPGTRETDLLYPINLVQQVHAVVLSGGSAFGLDAASGVVQYLEERGIGFDTRLPNVPKVPIVPAAILFDLQLGDPSIRPTGESGYKACQAARTGAVAQGNVGAGAGATVGKVLGPTRAMKAGLGTASIRLADGVVVGAIVAVNAWGQVSDPVTGRLLAGVRSADGQRLINVIEQIKSGVPMESLTEGQNTTIGVVATNAALSKSQATVVAQMAHDGLARTINPVHSPLDGDTIFALATGDHPEPVNVALVGAIAAEVMAQAVVNAVLHAESLPGLPGCKEIASYLLES